MLSLTLPTWTRMMQSQKYTMQPLLVLTVLALYLCKHGNAMQRHYYVKSTDNATLCPAPPCLTLDEYMNKVGYYFQSDTTLALLNGTHAISTGMLIPIMDVNNITLVGVGNGVSQVLCTNGTGFAFLNVTGLVFSNVVFTSCGARIGINLTNEAMMKYTNASLTYGLSSHQNTAIFLVNIHDLNVSGVVVEKSTGYGLLGINVLGDSAITNSVFTHNNYHTLNSPDCRALFMDPEMSQAVRMIGVQDCQGGNALFIYAELVTCAHNAQKYTLSVHSTYFLYGVDLTGYLRKLPHSPNDNVIFGGSGISVKVAPTSYAIEIKLVNVRSIANNAYSGPNMYFGIFDFVDQFSLIVENSTCERGNLLLDPYITFAMQPYNAGFYYYEGLNLPFSFHSVCWSHYPEKTYTGHIHIRNSSFLDNKGIMTGALFLSLVPRYNYKLHQTIMLESCDFDNNNQGGLLVYEAQTIQVISSPFEILVQNCAFTNNQIIGGQEMYGPAYTLILQTSWGLTTSSTVVLDMVRNITFSDCEFISNVGSGIQAKASTFYLEGNIVFQNNVGDLGPGVFLQSRSFLYLKPKTSVRFINNTAEHKGGAIYVDQDPQMSSCFFQVFNPEIIMNFTELQIEVFMMNNTAKDAGMEIYGGGVDACFSHFAATQPGPIAPVFTFDQIFHPRLENDIFSPSVIASNPTEVCLCEDDNVRCASDQPGYIFEPVSTYTSAFPGAEFHVQVTTVGQRKGFVAGVVRASHSHAQDVYLGSFQVTQPVRGCMPVTYQVFSSRSTDIIMLLRIDSADVGVQWDSINVTVKLLPCPPGFALSFQTHKCDCAPALQQHNLVCNINNQSIQRYGTIWISEYFPGNTSNSFLVHYHCPFDYCNPSSVDVSLSRPDDQCAYNHSGILCGKCRPGYSILFGSSKCAVCTNAYISLLLIFILAGVALIALLIVFNLTISMGTINGLIFYANIVQANQPVFFPSQFSSLSPVLSAIRYTLTVFIAWLNLDLGFEVCFYDGMDSYAKMWLQFAFPIYIWVLVGIIIYASRRSVLLVKLVGTNAISILCTLFLLSYAKLLRTISAAFSFTYITYPDDTTSARWLSDGNVAFLHGKHIPLFITAAMFGVLFIIPYTVTLVFAPCIMAQSGHWLLRKWGHNIMPFLDAYQGPYKDNTRYWTGLMLVVRIVLFAAFAINTLGDPDINLLITTSVVVFLFALNLHLGTVYKKWFLNYIESSYFLNLGILAMWSTYEDKDTPISVQRQLIVSCVLAGIAMIEFIAIIGYHVYLLSKQRRLLEYFNCCKREQVQNEGADANRINLDSSTDSQPDPINRRRQPTVTFVELRESLLTDN